MSDYVYLNGVKHPLVVIFDLGPKYFHRLDGPAVNWGGNETWF
jgi:hypothetical protein